MPDRAHSLLLTDLIAVGYDDRFLVAPEAVAEVRLAALGFTLLAVIYGDDFKGLFGQETVPYGVVAKDSAGGVYVAIRGTDDLKEWLEDGFAFHESTPFAPAGSGVQGHKGFVDLYLTLRNATGTPLKALVSPLQPQVTGHSLGAALATCLASDLGPSCAYCETFEGPRVFNKEGAAWMDSRLPSHFRDVIVGDVVPHAPPEILRYDHAGVEIDFDPAPLGPLPSGDSLEAIATRKRLLHILDSVQTLLKSA